MANRIYHRIDSASQREADAFSASKQSRNGEIKKAFLHRTGIFCLSFLGRILSLILDRRIIRCRDVALLRLYGGRNNRNCGTLSRFHSRFADFLHNRQDRQKFTASILTFVMLFQTIAGVFVPKDIFHLWNDQVANAGWFDAGYGYRKEIKIDHTKVAGDLANFPMLVSFTDPLFKTTGNGGRVTSSSGYDIIFTNASGSQKLDHEIEKYDGDAGTVVMWVKISALSASTDTSIYLYYGNSAITASLENKAGVWDDGGNNNFKGVWHLGETTRGAAADFKDSTANHNDSVNTSNEPTAATGQVDGAASFDGGSQYVDMGNSTSFNTTNKITVSAWVNTNSISVIAGIVAKRSGAAWHLILGADYKVHFALYQSDGTYKETGTAVAIPLNTWAYVTAVANGTDNRLYLNGIQSGTPTVYDGTIGVTTDSVKIGELYAGKDYSNGKIDEVRISSTARSAEWISTEYKNQSNPTEFSSLGIEEVSNAPLLSSFGYRKAITIDHTKVSGNLANFPVLINLPADASLQAHAQTDNDDILFTSSSVAWNTGTVNDKLASEIESYNSTNGSIQAWVKIPNLSSTTDTVIYMYYGNNTIASQQNKTVVWDSNTKMVQHMNQSGTGALGDYKDSTQYQNNSTNTTNQPTVAPGKIGQTQNFNGGVYIDVGNKISLDITDKATLGAWIKSSTTANTDRDIFGKQNSYLFRFFGGNTGKIQMVLGSSGAWNFSNSTFNRLDDDVWHYVEAVYDGSVIRIYVDGQIGADDRTFSGNIDINTNNLFIGARAINMEYFQGLIDEVRISDTARSAEWISTEYNNQSNPTEFSTLGIEEVQSPAALSSFGYRKAITIDHTKVAGNLANFPVLINLPSDASLQAHAQADNDDILFTSSSIAWNSGTINDKLASEIESYNSTNGSIQAWVKIPNLSSTVDTVIYMYYGNGSITSQQNKTAVWDNNTKMVQHMNQDPSGTAPQMKDSTQYGNDGTSGGGMTTGNQIAGQVGKGTSFDGTDDYGDLGNGNSLNITNSITVEAWANPSDTGATGRTIINKKSAWNGTDGGYNVLLYNTGVQAYWSDGTNSAGSAVYYAFTNGNWYHISVIITNKTYSLYVNGTYVGSYSSAYSFSQGNSLPVYMGKTYNNSYPLKGYEDEVRISNTARSAQWIQTEYNNQSNPTEFSTLGIEEVQSPAALSSFGYRKAITIDHTKVAGSLANFPVLVNLPADASLQSHAQTDNDDILFTSSSIAWNSGTINDKLASEIESYSSTTGSIQAWVKIPNLSSTTDTVIYMYYGNGSIASQQNKTVVWDNNTKMVQHMNQNPAGTAPQMIDSTQYRNNGTSGGSMTSGNLVTGRVDGATSFDGTDDYVDFGNKDMFNLANTNHTLSTWVKINSTVSEDYGRIINRFTGGTPGAGYFAGVHSDGKIIITEVGEGSNNISYSTSTPYNDSVWHSLHISVDTNSMIASFYIDGNLVGQCMNWGKLIDYNSTFRVGGMGSSYNFSGSIDEVRISNTARSASWIATEYNNQSSPSSFYALGSEQVYRMEITGSSAQTAGSGQTITLTAKNVSGSVMTDFSGDKAFALSGANAAPNGTNATCTDKNGTDVAFGTPMTLSFANGIATCNLKLYKAETASIAASGINSVSTNLSIAVSPDALNNFLVEAPASGNSGEAFAATITSRDAWNNTTRTVSGSSTIAASQGAVSPTSISSGNFTDDGVWSGNITISNITEQPSVSLTATNGSSSGSDSISILGIPADPQNASAARNSDYSMTLTWQDVSTVETGYLIERKINSGSGFGSYVQIGAVGANISSFTDDNVSNPGNTPVPDRSYQYRVRAVNSIGNSGYAEDTAVHYTTPNTPSNVFGTRLSDNSFQINYTDNAALTNIHRIERCSNANCGTSFETSLGNFASSPQTDSVSIYPDSRYRWQVRAEAPGISSSYEVSNFEYTTPAAPVMQNPVYVSSSQINVNWTDASSYEDGFRIEVSINGGAWQEVTPGTNTVGANIASYAYASSGDHNYKFRVRSHIGATVRNGELFSAYSGESVPVYTASAAPIIGTPVVNSSTGITWNWTDTSAFEENFHLHFVTGLGTDISDIPANSTSYASTGLVPNTKYSVHVHSYRADAGESDPSNPSAEVYTFANIPAELVIRKDSQQQLTALWSVNQNPAGTKYFVENMNTGKNSGWIADASWASGGLNCGTKYSFRVKAKNESGIETAFLGIADGMTEDCSPGLPSSYTNPPKSPQKTADNPAGELRVLINKDEKYAANPVVSLSLFAGSDAVRMAISNSTDFKDALLVPYQKEIKWNLDSSAEVSGDGMRTVYVKFYTKYGASSPAVSDSIILDTTGPAFSIANFKDKYYLGSDISLSGKTEAGARMIYNLDSQSLGAVSAGSDGSFMINIGNLAEGSHTLKLFARDALGNASDIQAFTFRVEKIPAVVPPADVSPAPAKPSVPASSLPQASNSVGQPSQAPASSAPSSGSDAAPATPSSPSIPSGSVSAPSVPEEVPASMSGEWNLLEVKPFPSGISTQDIGMIVEKFPEFKEIFKSLGINDFTDASQLQNASLMIPGISEVTGLSSAGLSSNLPAVTTPVTELSASMKKEIPQDVLFIRDKNSNMDINSDLTFENGAPNQKVALLPGKNFELVLRPDGDMDSVKGYLTYKGRQASLDAGVLDKIGMLFFGRSLIAHAEEDIEEKLVLSEFNYNDDDKDGIWTANISTPQVAGEYELITVLNYKDIKIGSKTLRMVTVIDPEGYVYRTEKDGEKTRITNVVVSLYWFNLETKKYELWNAEKYQQKNPQTTDDRGTYSFLVPPGSYYLKAEAGGYKPYQGKPFDVVAGNGVHANIELVPVLDWKDQVTWERVVIAIFGIALGCNFYWDRRTRKKLKAGNP